MVFKKLKTLIKSHANDSQEEVKEPVSVTRDSILDVKIGDIVIFGFNDLMELANEQFEVKKQILFQDDKNESSFHEMRDTQGNAIFVDVKSESEHIYVYKEVFFNDIEDFVSDDWDNFNQFLNGEKHTGFSFNESASQNDQDKYWFTNSDYTTKLFFEALKHERLKNSDKERQYGEVNCLCIVLQSVDREYRIKITMNENGETFFYLGRRIEPHNIEKVLGEE